jgi:CelD/BcsL family acetyltransferase involved in cellulose biosynthesis
MSLSDVTTLASRQYVSMLTEFQHREEHAAAPHAVALETPLGCEVLHDFHGLDHLQPAWDEAVLHAGGSIYMTYDWVRVWWEFYGNHAELRLFVFSAAETVVAVVPIYIDTLGLGPLRLRVARLVGANIPPKVFTPAIPQSIATEVFDRVLVHLFGHDRCDVLSVGPVSELDNSIDGLRTACERRSDVADLVTAETGVHSVYHLPADMDAYFSGLSQSERKNRRKLELRLLKKDYDTRVEVISDPAHVGDAFAQFAEQHGAQWRADGRTGHFGAWPRGLDFHRALIAAQAARGRLRFIRILANDQVVASEYAFAIGDRYYAELTSRDVDPKWNRFSLGPTSTVTMLAQGIVEGMRRVESGLGHYDYKMRLGAKEYRALTLRVINSDSRSRVRFALFKTAQRCVAVGYHKIWYRRVAPRLPELLWRPQSRLWLRLDF